MSCILQIGHLPLLLSGCKTTVHLTDTCCALRPPSRRYSEPSRVCWLPRALSARAVPIVKRVYSSRHPSVHMLQRTQSYMLITVPSLHATAHTKLHAEDFSRSTSCTKLHAEDYSLSTHATAHTKLHADDCSRSTMLQLAQSYMLRTVHAVPCYS